MATGTTSQESAVIDVVTPAAGESVTEGTVLEWHVKVGDFIKVDETIVEISTDKVDVELPSPASGTVVEILAAEGETVTVGQVIARLSPNGGSPAQGVEPTDPNPSPTPPANGGASVDSDGKRVSPVAARVAAVEGVDLGGIEGSGPAGRIVKADVLEAAGNGTKTGTANGRASAAAAPAGAQQMKGGAAALARYMEQSLQVPTATSFRTLTVTFLEARRKELKAAEKRVSFTHLIAYAIARAADDMQVMAQHYEAIEGKPHRVDDGQVNLGLAVDVEKKDGSRTLMVPVIRNAGRLPFKEFLGAYDALVEKARTNTLTAEDLVGGNITLTNPGGLGTIASVPRLMAGQGTIVATGSISYPPGLANVGSMIGAEKVMTMTSTYDHRIIQGAESGRFLGRIEEYLQGERGFYDGVFASLGVELGPAPALPAPAAAAQAAREAPKRGAADEELLQAVQSATALLKAFRTHGHLAARLDPLGVEPEGDPTLDPEPLGLTPEVMAQIPAKILRMHVPGATLADALPHLR
ncbi:MAG TPA: 2-oxo acid dehydrogenase subunit E2, partial [Solirubrobacteraceae bacterium]